jgi:hypothetical protein
VIDGLPKKESAIENVKKYESVKERILNVKKRGIVKLCLIPSSESKLKEIEMTELCL